METLWNAGLSARTAAPCRLRLATASLRTIALLLGLGADSAKACLQDVLVQRSR